MQEDASAYGCRACDYDQCDTCHSTLQIHLQQIRGEVLAAWASDKAAADKAAADRILAATADRIRAQAAANKAADDRLAADFIAKLKPIFDKIECVPA